VTDRDRREPARGARARANDRAIWDATVEAVAVDGLDRVTARQVAARAGMSSGAIYTRCDGIPDLLAEIWPQQPRSAFVELLVAVRDVLAGTVGADAVLDILRRPSPSLLAALELCIAAGRVAELAEVVPGDVRGLCDDLGLTTDSRLAGCAATAIGAVVYNPGDLTVATHVATVLHWVAAHESPPLEGPAPPPSPPPPFRFDTGDPDRDLLLYAAAEVTARSGVQHATLKRIGRVAGHVPSFVYGVYRGRDELFTELVTAAGAQLMGPDVEQVYGTLGAMAGRLAGWCHPDGWQWRRVALECCLTRTYFPQAWAAIRADDAWIDRASCDRVRAAFAASVPVASIATMLGARRPATYGAGLLAEVTGALAGMDWRPFLLPLVEGMRAG
jgi:AcrR family transcriptional regulator